MNPRGRTAAIQVMTEPENNGLTDLEFARRLRELDDEIQPERDLWVGVQRRILDLPQHRAPLFWMPYAVAASLLIAVSALMLNVVQVQQVNSIPVQLTGLEELQHEYVQVRNPMVENFTLVNQSLDEDTRMELYRNLEIMAQARRDIEFQIRANPDNHRLIAMLMKLHEQELALLKTDFTSLSRSM